MRQIVRRRSRRVKSVTTVLLVLLICNVQAMATDYVWTGDSRGDINWSNGENWGGIAPVNNGLADLYFDEGAAILNPFQNISKTFSLHSINFNAGADNYVLGGNTISFLAGGQINQNTAKAVTLQNKLNFDPATYTFFQGSGPATLAGSLAGGVLLVDTSSALTISGGGNIQALYLKHGATTITQGVLNLTQTGVFSMVVGSSFESATLSITGGAVLHCGGDYGGGINGQPGTSALVSGIGSKLTSDNIFLIGQTLSANLTIQNNAALVASAEVDVGSSAGSSGVLSVTSGGTVTTGLGTIAVYPGSTGSASVNGAGSVWTMSGALHVGGYDESTNGGVASLSVNGDGAVVVAGVTKMWSPASVITVNGGTLTTGALSNYNGDGNIKLTDPATGAALTLNAASGATTFSGSISGAGSIVKNGGSTQTLAGPNTYTGFTTVNGGTLVLSSGASASYTANSGGLISLGFGNLGISACRANPGGTIQYTQPIIIGGTLRGGGNHSIGAVRSFNSSTFGADAVITQDNPVALNNVYNSGVLTSNAALTWDGGFNTAAGSFTVNAMANVSSFENTGQVTINAKAMLSNSASNLVNGGGGRITIQPQGELHLNLTSLELNGSLLINNGAVTGGAVNVHFNGLATGSGTFQAVNLFENGRFAPGASASPAVFSPAVVAASRASFAPATALAVEIGGTSAGAGFDQVNVDGAALLAGALEVSTTNHFTPRPLDVFKILTFASRTGRFQSYTGVTGLPGGGGLAYAPIYGDHDLTLIATLPGDANLDGAVDFLDLARLAQSYNVSDGSREWTTGDFNGDGATDFLDLARLAQNYNVSALPAAALPDATSAFNSDLARAFASVPEPASPALLVGALVLLGRRSRATSFLE